LLYQQALFPVLTCRGVKKLDAKGKGPR